jgi:hypothetical protein
MAVITAPWQRTEFVPDLFLDRAAINFADATGTTQRHPAG